LKSKAREGKRETQGDNQNAQKKQLGNGLDLQPTTQGRGLLAFKAVGGGHIETSLSDRK